MTDFESFDLLWDHVETVNWGETHDSDEDTKVTKLKSLMNLSPVEVDKLQRQFDAVKCLLYDALDEADTSDVWIGDDGSSDLVSHVIGLGVDEVKMNLETPDMLVQRHKSCAYMEGFQYTVPFMDDYKYLTPDYHKTRARRVKEYYEEMYDENGEMYNDEIRSIFRFINGYVTRFNRGISHRDLDAKELREALKEKAEALEDITNKWTMLNFLKDYERYQEASS